MANEYEYDTFLRAWFLSRTQGRKELVIDNFRNKMTWSVHRSRSSNFTLVMYPSKESQRTPIQSKQS